MLFASASGFHRAGCGARLDRSHLWQVIFLPFQLMFHVDNGAGRFTAVYGAGSPGHMCDGRWHKVTAKKIKNRLELVVDGNQVDAQSPNAASTSADTNDPVFVGGFPGECWLPQQTSPLLLMFVVLNIRICITVSKNVYLRPLASTL